MGTSHNILKPDKNTILEKEDQQTEEFVPQHVDVDVYEKVLPYLRQDWLHTSNYIVSLWNRCSSWNTTGVVLCSAYFSLYVGFHDKQIFTCCIFKWPYYSGWISILLFFIFLALTELVKKTIAPPSAREVVEMLEHSISYVSGGKNKDEKQSDKSLQLFYKEYVVSLIKVDSEFTSLYLNRMKYFRRVQISAIVSLVLLGFCFIISVIGAK